MIISNKFNNIEIQEGKLDQEEFKKLSYLFKKVFKKEFSAEFFNWYYFLNPCGRAITNNALYQDRIVGHYAVVPIKIVMFEKKFDAALSVFTAVDEDFRGGNLFRELANKTYKHAQEKGIKFVIGISNQISTNLFIRFFKFKLISQLDVKFGFGKINKLNKKSQFKVLWNENSLTWRLKNPKFNYQIKFLNENLFIYNDHYKIFNIQMAEFPKSEFNNIFEDLKNITNFKLLNLWIGLGNYDWNNSYYFNFPEKLKPSPLNFIIKDVSGENHNIFLQKENMDFQLIDFDIF
jgi:GNAT superfamily N-acetyltransferase